MTHHPLRFMVRALLLATVAALSFPALAQWEWLDANGKRVFSDMAPPLSVPEKDIVHRPGVAVKPAKPAKAADSDAAAEPQTPEAAKAPSKAAVELEAKKKKAEEAEAAKKRAEADNIARAKLDNCQRAQRALVTLDSGTPMRTMNTQGERVFMDEAARNAEKARLQAAVRQSCN